MDILPVTLRWPRDSARDRQYEGVPCIELQYTFTPPVKQANGNTGLSNLRTTWALLDTGADRNVIDESLVPQGMPWLEEILHTGVNGAVISKNYQGSLFFPPLSWTVNCGLISMPHREDRPYGVILGRQFMQFFRFTYDGRVGGVKEVEVVQHSEAQ